MADGDVLVRWDGLDRLRKQLGASKATWERALRIAVRRSALRARREAREIVPGPIFDRSIVERVQSAELAATVFSLAARRTAESIAGGREPGQAPSIKQLEDWIRRYGLSGSVNVATGRRRRGSQAAMRALAVRLRRRIKARGTRPIPFISGAVQPSMADFRRYLTEAVARAMRSTFRVT